MFPSSILLPAGYATEARGGRIGYRGFSLAEQPGSLANRDLSEAPGPHRHRLPWPGSMPRPVSHRARHFRRLGFSQLYVVVWCSGGRASRVVGTGYTVSKDHGGRKIVMGLHVQDGTFRTAK